MQNIFTFKGLKGEKSIDQIALKIMILKLDQPIAGKEFIRK